MATPSVGAPLEFSLPVVAYYAEYTGLTADGVTKNALVMGGFPVGFQVNGAFLICIADSGSGTARAAYASYDRETFAVDTSDASLVNIDVYLKDAAGSGATIVGVLIW